jgi:nitroreductase
LQPWKFVVVEDAAVRQELLAHSWNQSQVVDASHLIVLCRLAAVDTAYVDRFLQDTAERRGVPLESLQGYRKIMVGFMKRMDAAARTVWMNNQIYLALGNLLTVCAFEQIDACPMEGFSAPDYDRILGLENRNLRSVVLCPVGFRANDDKYAVAPKIRHPFEDVVITI